MQPRIQLAFWAAGAHCWLMSSFSPTSTPKSFSAGLVSLFIPQPVLKFGGCPDPRAGPCNWLCWTSWGSHRPISRACLGPSGWCPVHLMCQPHLSAWCHLQTCWGYTQSCCLSYWLKYSTALVPVWTCEGHHLSLWSVSLGMIWLMIFLWVYTGCSKSAWKVARSRVCWMESYIKRTVKSG